MSDSGSMPGGYPAAQIEALSALVRAHKEVRNYPRPGSSPLLDALAERIGTDRVAEFAALIEARSAAVAPAGHALVDLYEWPELVTDPDGESGRLGRRAGVLGQQLLNSRTEEEEYHRLAESLAEYIYELEVFFDPGTAEPRPARVDRGAFPDGGREEGHATDGPRECGVFVFDGKAISHPPQY